MSNIIKLAIYARPSIIDHLPRLEGLVDALINYGFQLFWHHSLITVGQEMKKGSVSGFFSFEDAEKPEMNLLICLGGDGTILDTVPWAYRWDLPIMGFHFGRLGFLTTVDPGMDLMPALSSIQSNSIKYDHRQLLSCQYIGPDGEEKTAISLNELVVHRSQDVMMRIQCLVDGEILNEYRADGLIVSTPNGSTAYSMSCGGPIVLPGSKIWLITPVAGHQLGIRPVLVDDSSKIHLILDIRDGPGNLMVDGKSIPANLSYPLKIERAPGFLRIATLDPHSFLDNLRKKLLWGLDSRI